MPEWDGHLRMLQGSTQGPAATTPVAGGGVGRGYATPPIQRVRSVTPPPPAAQATGSLDAIVARLHEAVASGMSLEVEQLAVLIQIRDLISIQLERGQIVELVIPVTQDNFNQDAIFRLPAKLFSITIVNDGPATIQFYLPAQNQSFAPLQAKEIVSFSFHWAVLDSIALVLERGSTQTASVRILGTY